MADVVCKFSCISAYELLLVDAGDVFFGIKQQACEKLSLVSPL
jgi:hypothetical protein